MEYKKQSKRIKMSLALIAGLFALFFLLNSLEVIAQPTGIDITGNITESMLSIDPALRSDQGGTINTLNVDVLQQNPRWKAYVGNLTGTLTLDDSSGQSIFRWFLGAGDMSGEIYISRSNVVSWGDVTCNSLELQTIIDAEEVVLDFNSSSVDSINKTFNETTHPQLGIGTIDLNNCRSIHTYVNSTPEDQSSATFPIMLVTDTSNLIYASPINQGSQSYNNETIVDFQAIVPNREGESTAYYFYAEISS